MMEKFKIMFDYKLDNSKIQKKQRILYFRCQEKITNLNCKANVILNLDT